MPKPRGDHVVFLEGGGGFRCLHCGNAYPMELPCEIGVMAAAGKAYVRSHRGCRDRRQPADGPYRPMPPPIR